MTKSSKISWTRIDPEYHKNYFTRAFDALKKSKYPITVLKDISSKIASGITPLVGGEFYSNEIDGVPFIRSGNININGELNFKDLLYIKPEVHNTMMKSSKLVLNDLMIAIVGATIGQVGIYLNSKGANINQAIALVRLNQSVNSQYIKELIKSSIGQLSLNRIKRPVARANINLEEIGRLKVIVPPLKKQNEIATHIICLRRKAKLLQIEAINRLEKEKQKVVEMILGDSYN